MDSLQALRLMSCFIKRSEIASASNASVVTSLSMARLLSCRYWRAVPVYGGAVGLIPAPAAAGSRWHCWVDVERDLIRTRTAEWLSRATARGSTWAASLPHLAAAGRSSPAPGQGFYVEGVQDSLRSSWHT
jgi:hypothetical protein